MGKSIEQKIAETDEMLKQIIGNCELNVSIVELILRNIYSEVKMLSDENARKKINEYESARASAETESEGDDLKDDNTGN